MIRERFILTIEGEVMTPSNTVNYHRACQGIGIIEWLKINNNDFEKAAIFFDYHVDALKKKLRKLGYAPNVKRKIPLVVIEKAIIMHLETGSIQELADEHGFTKGSIGIQMRNRGYSLIKRCYVGISTKAKPVNKVSYQDILYNPILSYIGEAA